MIIQFQVARALCKLFAKIYGQIFPRAVCEPLKKFLGQLLHVCHRKVEIHVAHSTLAILFGEEAANGSVIAVGP